MKWWRLQLHFIEDFDNGRREVHAKEEWSSTFGWLLINGLATKELRLGKQLWSVRLRQTFGCGFVNQSTSWKPRNDMTKRQRGLRQTFSFSYQTHNQSFCQSFLNFDSSWLLSSEHSKRVQLIIWQSIVMNKLSKLTVGKKNKKGSFKSQWKLFWVRLGKSINRTLGGVLDTPWMMFNLYYTLGWFEKLMY